MHSTPLGPSHPSITIRLSVSAHRGACGWRWRISFISRMIKPYYKRLSKTYLYFMLLYQFPQAQGLRPESHLPLYTMPSSSQSSKRLCIVESVVGRYRIAIGLQRLFQHKVETTLETIYPSSGKTASTVCRSFLQGLSQVTLLFRGEGRHG